jgi:hypothetical protein
VKNSRPVLQSEDQLGSAGGDAPGSRCETRSLMVLPTRQARRAAPRTASPSAPRAMRRPLRERWGPGVSSCSYVSTCSTRSVAGTSCPARGLAFGGGAAGVTHRFRNANVSEPHAGQRSRSCTSSQSRQRRATPSRIADPPGFAGLPCGSSLGGLRRSFVTEPSHANQYYCGSWQKRRGRVKSPGVGGK